MNKQNAVEQIINLSLQNSTLVNSHDWKYIYDITIACKTEMTTCSCSCCKNPVFLIRANIDIVGDKQLSFWPNSTPTFCTHNYIACPTGTHYKHISNIGAWGDYVDYGLYKCTQCDIKGLGLINNLDENPNIKIQYSPSFLSFPALSCGEKTMNEVME